MEMEIDWSDVEYFLHKVYLQGRSSYSSLINRENGLNLSSNGLLSKTSPDSLKTQRKIVQIVNEIYETTTSENEKLIVSDMIEHYKDELVLMLAKDFKYPAVIGIKNTPKNSNHHADLIMKNLIEQFSDNFNQLIDLNSVQSSVDLANSALAAIHNNFKGNTNATINKNNSNNRDDDVICLTQSINNTNLSLSNDEHVNDSAQSHEPNPFMTAKQALARNINNSSRQLGQSSNYGNSGNSNQSTSYNSSSLQAKKLLGAKRRFVDPKSNGGNESGNYRDEGRDINTEFSYYNMNKAPVTGNNSSNATNNNKKPQAQAHGNQTKDSNLDEPIDERLVGIEPRIIEMIRNEIMHRVDNITWESIAGLEHAKNSIKEIVVWPMLRPDIFKGLRGPPKGLLLFGPPGTGKTMIGKCIASQAKATFFSISASSLTSKWVGEGEKMVRALFAVARCSQPAVIFIDEIDSLLTQRTDGEFEASRRIKTEFLVQFDGAGTNSEDRILVIGATNRPQEIDEAARRRLLKRLYIPLPEAEARATIIKNLLSNQSHSLSEEDINWICSCTDGYSGSDMDGLCREAAIGPIRSISDILNISTSDVRPISRQDFEEALSQVRASVSNQDLELYLDWNKKFGSLNVIKG